MHRQAYAHFYTHTHTHAHAHTGEESAFKDKCLVYNKSQKDIGPITVAGVTLHFFWLPSVAGSAGKTVQQIRRKVESILLPKAGTNSKTFDVVLMTAGLWELRHLQRFPAATEGKFRRGLGHILDTLKRGQELAPQLVWMNTQSVVEGLVAKYMTNKAILQVGRGMCVRVYACGRVIVLCVRVCGCARDSDGVMSQLNEIAANMMSVTPGVAFLDAFEVTVTVPATQTMRHDGRHYAGHVVLQVLNAMLNLVCEVCAHTHHRHPLPVAHSHSRPQTHSHPSILSLLPHQVPSSFARTKCQHRVPEIPRTRVGTALIEHYFQVSE